MTVRQFIEGLKKKETIISVTKELTDTAIFLTILVGSEFLLQGLPNYSFTVLLFALFFLNYKIRNSFSLIIGYTIMQYFVFPTTNIFDLVSMGFAWLIWLGLVRLVKNNTDNLLWVSIPFGILYGLAFIPLRAFIGGIDIRAYIIADIPFQINMMISNIITISLLFKPLNNAFKIITKEG